MKIIQLLFVIIVFNTFHLVAQKKEEQVITELKFETDKIILNKKHAFNYTRQENHFIISDLGNKEIITGYITSSEDGKFSSTVTFVQENKVFSNEKIIGRNDLFFRMLENNVITKDFKIDTEKLAVFFEKYNEIK